jgi:hypothetical protein
MRTLLKFAIACALSSAPAWATSLQFVQDGWETGAILNVSFSGEDADGDGSITVSELTAFSALWGPEPPNTSTWNLPDIQPDGFFFTDLDNYLVFTSNQNFSLVATAFEGEALSSVFDEFLFPVDSSAATPSAVPEPGGLAVFGLVLIGAARWRRRKLDSRSS